MTHLRALSALAVVSAAFSLCVACAAPVDADSGPTVAVVADGLTVIEADAQLGKLVAVFKMDGRAVTFHLRQGPQMELPPADPSLSPSYEIIARHVAAHGPTHASLSVATNPHCRQRAI